VLFVVVLFYARSGIVPYYWKLYATKRGRYEFQIDLGMSIINYAIEQDWPDLDKHNQTGCGRRLGYPAIAPKVSFA